MTSLLSMLSACAILQQGARGDLYNTMALAQARVAQAEGAVAAYDARLDALEEALRAQNQNAASKLESLDQVAAEVTRLRGELEVVRFELTELNRTVTTQQTGSERRLLHAEARLRQVEGFLNIRPPPPPTDAEMGLASTPGAPIESPTPPPDPTPSAPPTVAGKLALAREHLDAGRPAVARALLERALTDHPEAMEIDEIRYRIGEAWQSEGNPKAAAKAWQQVVDQHPKSNWSCWSLYRIGTCFEQLGQAEGAKAFFAGATEGRCAKSDAAKEAKKKL